MESRKSESSEVLLEPQPSKTARLIGPCHWPIQTQKGSNKSITHAHSPLPPRDDAGPTVGLCWGSTLVGSVLRTQLVGISVLAWLIVVVYGCNFPVKTLLSSDFVPLWSLWLIIIYALALSIGVSFHFYTSPFGVVVSGLLQGMTLAFSAYFSLITLNAMEIHGRLDKNDTTRLWGGLLYGTIVGANGAILITSLILILSAVRDTWHFIRHSNWSRWDRSQPQSNCRC